MMKRHSLTIQAGLCLVGCLQLVAWTSLVFQLPFLYGRHGVQPISSVLDGVQAGRQQLELVGKPTLPLPSVLWLHGALGLTAEALLAAVCAVGWLLSAAAACGATHPLVFAALWALYLSFVSLGGSFVEYGDEVLLEVCFASIWAAVAHSIHKRAAQQQQQHEQPPPGLPQPPSASQRLSTAVLMLHKWLLFRLLLSTSVFAATLLCGQDPVLGSCFKTLLAHGQPHAATRWLQTLPGPVRAAAAAVALLELPAAFCVLVYVPALQRAAGVGLLALQLLRVTWGSAGLANLAAAVLCFMLLDDGLWVPWAVRLAQLLRVGGPAGAAGDSKQQQEQHATEPLSRTSSGTSLFAGEMGEGALEPELGPSAFDNLGWVPWAALAALLSCAALLFTYNSSLGLLMRPMPAQLYSVLQVAVPLAMLVWLGSSAPACWLAVSAAWCACKADAEQARLGAQAAADRAAQESREAADAERQAEQAAALAAAPAMPAAAGPSSARKANGATPNGVHAAAGGADDTAEAADAEGEGHEEGAVGAGGSRARAPKKSAGGKAAAAGKAGKGKAAAAQGDDGSEQPGSPAAAADKAGASSASKAAKAAAAKAAAAQAAAATRAAEARKAAAAHRRDAAAASADAKRLKRHAALGAWVPAVCAGAAAVAVLAVFVAGTPHLLTAASFGPASVRALVPGPILQFSQLGRAFGVTSGTSSARASYAATQRAAAAAGPGSVLQYEAYVMAEDAGSSSWKKAPLQHMLGSPQLKARASLGERLAGARGWFQTRLQARMAAAAGAQGGAQESGDASEPWLVVLADKIVQGSPDIAGLLGVPLAPHTYVTVNRIAYTPADDGGAWRLDASAQPPVVAPQHRDSTLLRTFSQIFAAVPGDDGWLVSLLEALARSLSGPLVLAALLLAVALRHLLLPGGLLGECLVERV